MNTELSRKKPLETSAPMSNDVTKVALEQKRMIGERIREGKIKFTLSKLEGKIGSRFNEQDYQKFKYQWEKTRGS